MSGAGGDAWHGGAGLGLRRRDGTAGEAGRRINGIRIYDVKPLLVVSGTNVTLQYVPNYNRAYALRFGAFLAKNDFDASIANGLLTKVNANMDSTEFIKVLGETRSRLRPGQASPARRRRPRPAASRTASRSTTSSSTTTATWSGRSRC